MKTCAISLTYNPVGGALEQIKQIIANVDAFSFDQVIFYVAKDNLLLFDLISNDKVHVKTLWFSSSNLILRTLWEQFVFPFRLLLEKIDVLFCPGNIAPILCFNKKVQWIGTVGPFEKGFYGKFDKKERIILNLNKWFMIASSRTSDKVIFESEYTRDKFTSNNWTTSERSEVLQIGKDEFYYPKLHDDSAVNNYILTVSHLYPYKNIEILLDVYSSMELDKKGIKLLIAGNTVNNKYYNKLKDIIMDHGISKHVQFLGCIDKGELRILYSNCKLFVFTSPYENFAYTLIEAMSCGAPIISTNTTAMPESCLDAAVYFAPNSRDQLRHHIDELLENDTLRSTLKAKSLQRAAELDDYQTVNRKTNEILNDLLEEGS